MTCALNRPGAEDKYVAPSQLQRTSVSGVDQKMINFTDVLVLYCCVASSTSSVAETRDSALRFSREFMMCFPLPSSPMAF